jgi:hypothetical protein
LAKFNLEFFGDALGNRPGSDSTGLGVCDGFATQIKAHFGNLGSFTRTRRTCNNYYLVMLNRLNNLFAKK